MIFSVITIKMFNKLIDKISNYWICKYCLPEEDDEIRQMIKKYGEEAV